MNANFDKLKSLLKELFQLDRTDLDFGIYRIMNQKHDEIVSFLEHDLLPQVQDVFKASQAGSRAVIGADLQDAIEQAKKLGADPDSLPKVKELRAKYGEAIDVTALENEVFSDLYNFFRRYYHEGDFLSLRRYKEGVYAIPYEGEEVKLHWANHDQYYIKTSESFRDYTFKLSNGKRVHFKIVEADTEKDNSKVESGKERRFMLAEERPVQEENGELIIRFVYQPDTDKRKQDAHNEDTVKKVLAKRLPDWIHPLSAPAPTEKSPKRTLLEKHLTEYTARNTFDYFIHKDLGGFLKRELDFYVKNEILHIDDIENESAVQVDQKVLNKIKAIRKIALKIVEFLAQLENFQKKLWLKKKFVVETNYCITLDRIPDELYPEIAKSDAQREEWVRLFAIDEIKGDMVTPKYTKPLKKEFLKANPHLVLDTRHFDVKLRNTIISSIDNLDNTCDGVLINSENSQALMLLSESLNGSVRSIYIDPPYNTMDGDFPYKDNYAHSSWLSMMRDRCSLAKLLLSTDGHFVVHLDEHEVVRFHILLGEVFHPDSVIGPVIWDKRNPKGDATGIASQHEYLCWTVQDPASLKTPSGEMQRKKTNAQTILAKAESLVRKAGKVTDAVRDEFRSWLKEQAFSGGELAYNCLDEDGNVYRPVSMAWPNKKKAPDEYYEPLIHPKTKKPCPIPARGWRNPPATMKELLEKKQILFGSDETTQPTRKYLLKDNLTENVPSLFYYGGSDDDLQVAMGYVFPNPKPVAVGEYIISITASNKDSVVLDFFAGSGTTGHSVINMNRDDNGKRRYVLVEMGEYFDTVLKSRIEKVIYSKDWKDNKPVSRQGSSHMFKYIRLESYEDALNNLMLTRKTQQDDLLKTSKEFRESYMLSYMLDVESKDSLLNIQRFEDPFNYQLKIATGSAGETKPVTVDLAETFNYLIGLTVKHIDFIRGIKVIEGTDPKGNRVLVLWRKVGEMNNDKLDEWFKKQGYNTKDMEYDLIYVNGDNNLENLRRSDQTWKVRLIEEDFHRLMFECKDV